MKKPKVRFYIRPTTAEHGEMLIEANVSWLGRRLQVKLGETIPADLWDKKTQRPTKLRRKELQELTARLDEVETFLQNFILEYKHQRRLNDLTVDKLRREFKMWLIGGAPIPRTNEVLNWIDRYLLKLEATRPAKNTIKQYRSEFNNFSRFVNDERAGSLAFQEVDYRLFCEFRDWLFAQGSGDNNCYKNLKHLRTFLRQAALQGEAVKEWNFAICNDLGVCPEDADALRLGPFILDLLASNEHLFEKGPVKLPDHLERAKDWFLVGCYTGARYSDWAQLKTKLGAAYRTRSRAVHLITAKTKAPVVIPIIQKLWDLLEKYDGDLPPVLENQPFNRAIKEVFERKGLDRMTEKVRTVKGRKVVERIPMHKRIGSHTARRTFAYNAFYFWEIPISDIRAITGHSTEAQCRKYIGEDARAVEDRLLGHDIFNYKPKDEE